MKQTMKRILASFLVVLMLVTAGPIAQIGYGLNTAVTASAASTLKPGRVTGVSAKTGYKTVKLSWKKVDKTTKYYVFRYNTKTKKYTALKTTTGTTCTISGLKVNTAYIFAVQAMRTYNKKNYWGAVSSLVTVKTSYKPQKVTGFKATSVTTSSVNLSWTACPDATGYYVFKYDTKTKKYKSLGRTNKTYRTISGLAAGTSYKLAVQAYVAVNKKTYWGTVSSLLSVKTAPKVELNKTSLVLSSGNSYQLKVKNYTGKVSYSTSNKKVAAVSSSGKVTAKAYGTATITAKLANGKKFTCKITVNPVLSAQSIILCVGESRKVTLKGASVTAVSTANKSVATVSKSGTVKGISVGTTKITYKGSNGKYYTLAVRVENPTISKTQASITVGKTLALKLKGNTQKITWYSSKTSVATIDANGVVKAIKEGSAYITAKLASGKKLVCKVTVVPSYKTFTVTFNTMGGSAVKSIVAKENSKIKEPAAPVKDGYTFAGWYTMAQDGVLFDFNTPVRSNITLYAHWIENSMIHTIHFDSNGGSEVADQTVIKNEYAVEPVDPERDGYVFDGWYTALEGGSLFNFTSKITADMTLYAHWEEDTEEETVFGITFVLNDGTDGAYLMQNVNINEKIVKPEDPTRDNYRFGGWYTDPGCTNEFNFSTRVKSDITLYAYWIAPDESGSGVYTTESETETTYAVSDVEVTDGVVYTQINTNSACVLVLRFIDENDASNVNVISVRTPDYCEKVSISSPINFELPQYYTVEATLYNENEEPLCDKYVCDEYTEKFEQHLQSTVEDYSNTIIVNFDDSYTNNFGVMNEDSVHISHDNGKNKLVYQEKENSNGQMEYTYTFSNVDEQVINLTAGDTVICSDIDGEYRMFKIKSISKTASGTYVAVPDDGVELTDFYQVLKVDMNTNGEEDTQENQMTARERELFERRLARKNIEVIDVPEATTEGSFSPVNLTWKPKEWLAVNFHISISASATIEMTYDAKLFAKDYFKCKIVTETVTEVGGSVTASIENKKMQDKAMTELKLPQFKIPTSIPGLSIVAKSGFPVELSAEGSAEFTFTSTSQGGFSYDTNNGRQNIEKKEKSFTIQAKGKVEIKAGPKVTIGIGFIEKPSKNPLEKKYVVEANLSLYLGVKIKGVAEINVLNASQTVDSKHWCGLCVSITANWFAELSASLEVHIVEDVLDREIFSAKLLDFEGTILFGDFNSMYVSVVHEATSIFGTTEIKAGLGECPNKKYRTKFIAKDENENVLSDVNVTVKRDGRRCESGTSTLTTYLYPGLYTAEATIDDTDVSKSFIVKEDPQDIVLTKDSSDGAVIGNLKSAADQSVITDAEILIKQGSTVIASGKSDGNGDYSINVPEGTYSVNISKSGFVTFIQYVSIENATKKYMGTSYLVPGDSKITGGFGGKITNAVTGNGVDNVTLTIYRGWDNISYDSPVKTLKTNETGYYKYRPTNIFGVNFGLNSGNYTVVATKENYASTTFNIVILPDQDKDGQDGVMSPLTTGDYRVVLKWGSTPADLDSHLTAQTASGNYEHVYFNNEDGYVSNLDRDDRNGEGPETITVTGFDKLKNGFTYSVHDYTNRNSTSSSAMSYSGATVQVYLANQLIRTYNVPTGKVGTVWKVFSIDSNGRITDINSFYNASSPSNVY